MSKKKTATDSWPKKKRKMLAKLVEFLGNQGVSFTRNCSIGGARHFDVFLVDFGICVDLIGPEVNRDSHEANRIKSDMRIKHIITHKRHLHYHKIYYSNPDITTEITKVLDSISPIT